MSKIKDNQVIERLIHNAQISLDNSDFYDESIDAWWWSSKDYWSEKDLDGVRSIILYTIIDSTKVMSNIELLRKHQFDLFVNHREVSSLMMKITKIFPDESLSFLQKIMLNYKEGMMIFNPYGDHICKNLYSNLDIKKKRGLDQIIVQLLNEESIDFNNWFPIFRLLVEYGQNEQIKLVLDYNANKLKNINHSIYINAIAQAKAKLNGYSYYEELIGKIYEFKNHKSIEDNDYYYHYYYGIFHGTKAIQLIVDNSELSLTNRKRILNDLSKFKTILDNYEEAIKLIEKLEKQLE